MKSESQLSNQQLQNKRVLVVDDEESIRQSIADVIDKHGCVVETSQDGREAIGMINGRHYDLVICDIKMPHASGYDVFAAAQATGRKLPVILMTGFGYDPNHAVVRANKEGLNAVLYKPFKVGQLMQEIHHAMKLTAG